MLGNILARPEQASPPNSLTQQFPLFALAGRHAAQLWIQFTPLTMADWRDLRFRNLIAGTMFLSGDEERHQAFDQAFADEIGRFIAQQSRGEVRHD